LDKTALTNKLKAKAHELGFVLFGVTGPEPPAHSDVYQRWLQTGRHGEMGYLETERAIERRKNPKQIMPDCKSVLVLGIPYDNPTSRQEPKTGEGRVAAYAWGADYHEVLPPRLKNLVDFMESEVGHPVSNRWYTDTGPILERELAQRAGLGWIGKNTMLINPQRGSYFLLAEIFLGIELDYDVPITNDYCGSCRLCIEACPTNCILEDRTLNAKRCISYLTIELKRAIPLDLRPQIGNWTFGCDICQIVCPWNKRFADMHGEPAFSGVPFAEALDQDLVLTPNEFNKNFKSSPVLRAKRRGYLRNVAVAVGNAGSEDLVRALSEALVEEEEPLVRAHAAWALGQIGSKDARSALEQSAERETDESVLEEIQVALS
jgi:epoxyqueuosine reductase